MVATNAFLCGDSYEILKEFPNKSIDICLTDPPYGINLGYDGYNDTQDNLKQLIDTVMPQLVRVCKLVVLTTGINNINLYPKPTWILSWVYDGGVHKSSWGFNCWQPILVYGKDPYLANSMGCRSDVIHSCCTPEKNGHPCPKPISFWTKLLNRISVSSNDIVLDPFAGSCTTAIICYKSGRRFICIDQSQKYIDIGKQLYENVRQQQNLFIQEPKVK